MNTISFRFDLNGIRDIRVGVPILLDLANELNVKFSFYVNMGKSINLEFSHISKGLKFLRKLEKYKGKDRNPLCLLIMFTKSYSGCLVNC